MQYRTMTRRLKRYLIAGVAFSVFTPGIALAQTSNTATAKGQTQTAPSAAAPDGSIADIVVTAQKRAENAQDVPIAITAFDNTQLRAAGVTSTADLKATVPALNVTTATAGYGLPRIRGIGATGQGPGIENPVAVYVDGVYYGAAFGVLQSLYDIDQVAVLKGPQGTLFGRNATGGLIQITTLGPDFDYNGRAEFGYGSYGTVNAAAYVSGGLSNTVAVSLSAQYDNQQDGYGKNVGTGHDIQAGRDWAGRAKLLWKPSDDSSILLEGDFNGRNASEPAFRNFTLNTLGQDVPQAIIAAGGDPRRDILSDYDPFLRAHQWGVSGTATQKLGGVTLKSITAYRDTRLRFAFDPDGTAVPELIVDNTQFDRQLTEEVNLVSNGSGPFKWEVGGFFMKDTAGLDPARVTGLFTYGNNGYSDIFATQRLQSYAGYAQGTYTIGGNTDLTAGLRYTSDHRSLDAHTVDYNGNIDLTTVGAPTIESKTFNKLTWRFSIEHRFSPELMAYASYNRGFRSGTYIPQASPIYLLKPEMLDAYELGIKSDLFDRHVRLNLAGYYYNESNLQVMQVIAGYQTVYNANGAHIYGVDADLTWRVSRNFSLFGGLNYNHARYTDFSDAIISVPFPLPAGFVIPAGQSCLGTFGNPYAQVGGNCLLHGDASGNKLQNTPAFTASIGGSLDIPSAIGRFTLAGNYYYNDGYVGSPDERVIQKAYNTVDASLTWHLPGDNVFIRAWGKNLTNAFYWSQIGATNSGDNGTYAAPRTYGATIGFNF